MASIHWHEIPFVRICIPFAVGILLEQAFCDLRPLATGIAFSSLLALFLFIIKDEHINRQMRTALMFTLIFTVGAFARRAAEPAKDDVLRLATYDGQVKTSINSIEKTDYGQKASLKLLSPLATGRNLRIVAYIRDSLTSFLPCDTLIFRGGLQKIRSPGNPYAFDAGAYYRRQGIHLKTYLDSTKILCHSPYQGKLHLLRKSAELRNATKTIYTKYLRNDQSRAVLLAMTIGVVDGLDDSIYDAYAKSGAIHVLSISGLHVGIVSVLLYVIVGRVRSDDSRWSKLLRASVLLGGIWAFTLIAGLSPSVIRAALMSSIYLVGKILCRPVKGLNVLAFTAFLCLCINPLQINSLSFQFSYLALCGLLIFFKPLYRLVSVKSYTAKLVWSTVVMSVAAQVLLLPLLIHYFNQVSLVSVISSLVAVPASYGILIGGVALLLFHYSIPYLAENTGRLLDHGIAAVNHVIIEFSELPYSYLSNLYLPPIEIGILCGVLVLISLCIVARKKSYVYTALIATLFFGIVHIALLQKINDNAVLAIYPNGEQIAVDFITGRSCFTTFDVNTMSKYKAKEVATFRSTSRAKVSNLKLSSVPTGNVQVLDIPSQQHGASDTTGYRIAILTASGFAMSDSTLLGLHANWIVISDNVSTSVRRATKSFCSQYQQQYHDLREHGTFYLTKLQNNNSHETHWQNISG